MITSLIYAIKERIAELQQEITNDQELAKHVGHNNKLGKMQLCLLKLVEIDNVFCEMGEFFLNKENYNKTKTVDFSALEKGSPSSYK